MDEVVILSYWKKYCQSSAGDNTIDAIELKNLCYDLGVYLYEEQAVVVLGNLDLDGSGTVTYDEFLRWWRTEHKFDKLASLADDEMQKAISYFQYFDVDRNGVVSRSEWEALHADLITNGMLDAASGPESAWSELVDEVTNNIRFNDFLTWMGLANC